MQEYNQLSENSALRGSFLNAYPLLAANSSPYGRASSDSTVSSQQTQMPLTTFHLQSSEWYQSAAYPIVKTEASNSKHGRKFQYPLLRGHQAINHQEARNESSIEVEAIKGKIVAHPQYLNLLKAYMDCQKVGAPPEVVARLSAAGQEFEARQRSSVTSRGNLKDPELDQFMEAYHGMLVKYLEELTRPIQESFDFMQRIEAQLNLLSNGPLRIFNSDEKCEYVGSSEEDQEDSGGEIELPAEDQELKNHLLRKYSGGCISSLKQELSKKKKRGKLPEEARQNLLRWWELHYKWPYPSETEKLALAESTGLNQKQINNWFINQRKRHWKPSENMQFMVTEGLQPQNAADGPYLLGW